MQKFMCACLLLVIIAALQSKAFAAPLNCAFKDAAVRVDGVESLQVTDDVLIVNAKEEIQLEHSVIKCGALGRQHRFDGFGKGLQIILKSCSDSAVLEGHLIDSKNEQVASIVCDEAAL